MYAIEPLRFDLKFEAGDKTAVGKFDHNGKVIQTIVDTKQWIGGTGVVKFCCNDKYILHEEKITPGKIDTIKEKIPFVKRGCVIVELDNPFGGEGGTITVKMFVEANKA